VAAWKGMRGASKKPAKAAHNERSPIAFEHNLFGNLAPYRGRVYGSCCGLGGMFVQSEKSVEARGGRIRDISVYGEESNFTTWRLAKMNLVIRGLDGQIAHGDTFHNDRHPDIKADFILANPPFNISDWGGERLASDKRWQHGAPPKGNWLMHNDTRVGSLSS
jgi:type I restriction enzyme M protein